MLSWTAKNGTNHVDFAEKPPDEFMDHDDDKARFEMDDNNVNKVSLKISSKLLSLAKNRPGGA